MKIKNKKTGEVVTVCPIYLQSQGEYNSLTELNEDWEDYEEDKYYYAITSIKFDNGITKMKNKHNDMTAFDKSIGNYFETKEEAEKAVLKLKAWKRLKDKGFKFNGETCDYKPDKHFGSVFFETDGYLLDVYEDTSEFYDDLDLLFGGEE